MMRRPWPLVILALLQLLSPAGSLFISAYVNHVSVTAMASAIWHYSGIFALLTFYALPVFQGAFIFFAKKTGYYIVIALAAVSILLGFQDFRVAQETLSLPIFLSVLALNGALIGYLCLPKVRLVFMNARLRWWETAPRYVVSIPAILTAGENKRDAKLVDLAVGGAGILTEVSEMNAGETCEITFTHGENVISLKAKVVYVRKVGLAFNSGLQWETESARSPALNEVLLELHQSGAETVNKPPKWEEDLRAWWDRARKSKDAWMPEIPSKK